MCSEQQAHPAQRADADAADASCVPVAKDHAGDRDLIGLGSGDSRLLFDIVNDHLVDEVLSALQREVNWAHMSHKGGVVPRLVALQGDADKDAPFEPVYRHPVEAQPTLAPFSSTVERVRQALQRRLNVRFNHALLQWYRSGDDFISEHADKTLDIERGTDVVVVSFGASREMVMRRKHDVRKTAADKAQRVALVHNSAFCLGSETNAGWTHEIRRDRRAPRDKRDDEKRDGGHRISLSFRTIATFRRRSDGRLFGQGARGKTEQDIDALPPLLDTTQEARRMLEAFAAENRSSNFDWERHYGGGFDAIDLDALQSASAAQ